MHVLKWTFEFTLSVIIDKDIFDLCSLRMHLRLSYDSRYTIDDLKWSNMQKYVERGIPDECTKLSVNEEPAHDDHFR